MRFGRAGSAVLSDATTISASTPLAGALNQPFYIDLFRRTMIFAISALSLDLILGYGGLVSFGHAAYLGIGAYDLPERAYRNEDRSHNLLGGRGALRHAEPPLSTRRR